ncbi:hypothetical protein C8F01DRAFT_544309 [Mycena amicta]|nr:hypothetical protein C8F01DRAFT_544309 [Mycena amicta]
MLSRCVPLCCATARRTETDKISRVLKTLPPSESFFHTPSPRQSCLLSASHQLTRAARACMTSSPPYRTHRPIRVNCELKVVWIASWQRQFKCRQFAEDKFLNTLSSSIFFTSTRMRQPGGQLFAPWVSLQALPGFTITMLPGRIPQVAPSVSFFLVPWVFVRCLPPDPSCIMPPHLLGIDLRVVIQVRPAGLFKIDPGALYLTTPSVRYLLSRGLSSSCTLAAILCDPSGLT